MKRFLLTARNVWQKLLHPDRILAHIFALMFDRDLCLSVPVVIHTHARNQGYGYVRSKGTVLTKQKDRHDRPILLPL